LKINYLRNVSTNQLVNRTEEEWRKRSIDPTKIENWLFKLNSVLPNVRKGETLTLQVEDDLSSSFYNNADFLGNIAGGEFTEAFLSIWLAEDSSYPELQAQLIGKSN